MNIREWNLVLSRPIINYKFNKILISHPRQDKKGKNLMLRIRIRDLFDPWSRIPNPYFQEVSDNFLGKKFYNSLKIGPNFFLQHFKNKVVKFYEIYGSKKR